MDEEKPQSPPKVTTLPAAGPAEMAASATAPLRQRRDSFKDKFTPETVKKKEQRYDEIIKKVESDLKMNAAKVSTGVYDK